MALFRSLPLEAGVAAGPVRRRLGPGRHGSRPVRDRAAGRRLARRRVRRGTENRAGARERAARRRAARRRRSAIRASTCSASDSPPTTCSKWVSTASSVDQLLSKAGLPIWGRERPATLVMFGVEEAGGAWRWLAADTPAREREAIDESRAAARLAAEVARDGSRRSAPRPAPSHRGLMQAAARYGANAVLIGRARGGIGPLDAASRAKAQRRPAAVSTTACTWPPIRSRACLPPRDPRSAASWSRSRVSPISDAYAATLNYLEGMTLVRGVALEQVAGDTMRFRLAVRGDAATLRRAIALDHRLVPHGSRQTALRRIGSRSATSPERTHAAHPQCALHPAHAAGRAGRLAAGRPTIPADARDVRVRGRDRRPGRLPRQALSAGPRSSARSSIRSPTRSCWSACSSRSPRSASCRSGWRSTAVARDVIITAGAITYNCAYGYLHGRPTAVSKLNTLCQIIYLLLVVAARADDFTPQIAITVLGALVFVTTVVSGTRLRHHLFAQGNRGQPPAPRSRVDGREAAAAGNPAARYLGVRELLPGTQSLGRRCARCAERSPRRRERRPTCVWVHGAPSVGKTHLLQALCARARRQRSDGCVSAAARGRALGEEIALGLRPIRARVSRRCGGGRRRCRLGARVVPPAPGAGRAGRPAGRVRHGAARGAAVQVGRPGFAAERRRRAHAAAARRAGADSRRCSCARSCAVSSCRRRPRSSCCAACRETWPRCARFSTSSMKHRSSRSDGSRCRS